MRFVNEQSRCGVGRHETCSLGSGRYLMLMTLGIILLILWALGFLAFHVGGGLIHILIVLALISIVMHLVRGRR